VIAGDKSLVSLVAHELAHSWSGNLVTNATWHDFWLNEGLHHLPRTPHRRSVVREVTADMQAAIGVSDLAESRKTLDVAGDRTLLPDLTGRDPDDAFSSVPYEQGSCSWSSRVEVRPRRIRKLSAQSGSTSTRSRVRPPRNSSRSSRRICSTPNPAR
jgi:hypothetical protein